MSDTTEVKLEDLVRSNLRRVIDPEIGINIVDLGLVYNIDVNEESDVQVLMTLTAPNCPFGATSYYYCFAGIWIQCKSHILVLPTSYSSKHLLQRVHLQPSNRRSVQCYCTNSTTSVDDNVMGQE